MSSRDGQSSQNHMSGRDGLIGKRLFIGGERSVRRTLAMRAALVLIMYSIVIVAFWIERDGLTDHVDGQLTFVDVVYFSMITVTTVGYGDIVPFTASARITDAVLVTPIRLLIWFIFLGTTYQLVLQRLLEDLRMRRLQARLTDHVIVCGYSHSGSCVAHELVQRGMDKKQVLIVDSDRTLLEEAAERGFIGILGDATREETLQEAMIATAKAVFVCTERDDTNVLIVLTVRQLAPGIRVVARVEEAENEKLVKQSGADATILPSRVGGILMANALDSSVLSNYAMDLISAKGRVVLIERQIKPEEAGRSARDIRDAIAVAVVREGRELSIDECGSLQPGDRLLVIRQV